MVQTIKVVALIFHLVSFYLHRIHAFFTAQSTRAVRRFAQDNSKEEQWKIQQEILARRKNKSKMKEYFNKVEERRVEVSKIAKASQWALGADDVDPIVEWKRARDAGKIKPIGYEPEPTKADSKLGINVIIPGNPMGIPKYDNGERFDLRLPYAERGYVDPNDVGVVGNFIAGWRKPFGGGGSGDSGSGGGEAKKI